MLQRKNPSPSESYHDSISRYIILIYTVNHSESGVCKMQVVLKDQWERHIEFPTQLFQEMQTRAVPLTAQDQITVPLQLVTRLLSLCAIVSGVVLGLSDESSVSESKTRIRPGRFSSTSSDLASSLV